MNFLLVAKFHIHMRSMTWLILISLNLYFLQVQMMELSEFGDNFNEKLEFSKF